MDVYLLTCPDRGTTIAERLGVASSFFSRLKGLLGRDTLPEGEGLYIVPCDAIHMFGMKFPIDTVFVSEDLTVLDVFADVPIGGKASCRGAHGVLELPAGTAARHGIAKGDRLSMTAIG